MANTTGQPTHPVITDLLRHGCEFSFSQVMRLARMHLGAGGEREVPEVPWQRRVHIRPELSLVFPAADVARVERTGDDGADFLVSATFLGLYGTSSPLPTHYTEDLLEEAAADSSVSRDFLDLLHQRLYQLYFQCWSKYRLFIRIAEEKNPRDLERLFCLIGLGEKELRDSVPNAASLLRFAGLFTQSPRSALGLRTLLRGALGVGKLEVEQCVPRRVPIPEDQRMRLGVANMCLGVDTVLGSELPERLGKFRIRIGPLSKREFDTFLPGTPRHDRLARLTRLYITDPFDFDLQLTMAAGEARPISLGDPDGQRLGWNSWCFSGEALGEVSAIFPLALSAGKGAVPADNFSPVPERTEPTTLLDFYQEELARLRDLAADYAKAHPALASMVTGNPADPSVERLFEGVAFLNANLQLKLNDDWPEIIHELTEGLHPWDLRPIPATSIVTFTPKADLAQPLALSAGTEVASIPVQGTKCRFRTCFDVTVHPLTLLDAAFSQPSGQAPSIRLQCQLNGIGLSGWQPKSLRFFLGDDYPAACDLYLVLLRNLKRIIITAQDSGAAIEIPSECLKPVGFADSETMLTNDKHFLPGHLILQEYFLFHDKFLILEIRGLDACCCLGDGSRFEIYFELTARPLVVPQVNEKSFVLFATPVINLFKHKARPLEFVAGQERQKVRPVGKNQKHFAIHSVDQVNAADFETGFKRTYQPQSPHARHGKDTGEYHITHALSDRHGGFDTFLGLTEGARTNILPGVKLDIDLTCTNGILPEKLGIGDVCLPTSTTPATTISSNITQVVISHTADYEQNRQ